MAVPFEVLDVCEPTGVIRIRIRTGDKPDHFFENGLVAGNRQWALATEAVLFLRLAEEFLEDGMVQVRQPHHKSPATRTHIDRHVSRRHICRDAAGRDSGLVPPPPQHLANPHNVADFAAFS
ncbi:hypothetical protein GQ457_13G008260 [Hibiscus cannabinus]